MLIIIWLKTWSWYIYNWCDLFLNFNNLHITNIFFKWKIDLHQKLICIFLRYKSDFLNIRRFWNKEKDYAWLCLWLFVLFNSCSINLCYEWNSLQKNLFHIFFEHMKKRFDFSVIKNLFFLIITKWIWSFTKLPFFLDS